VARQLQQFGINRVRPLQGGFQGWKELDYPLEEAAEIAWRTTQK
jgi:3-mercaptopyruvate sulfurtransferase SseA